MHARNVLASNCFDEALHEHGEDEMRGTHAAVQACDFALYAEATRGRRGREQQHRQCLCPALHPANELLFVFCFLFVAAVRAGRKYRVGYR
jgi:hypothetical protein